MGRHHERARRPVGLDQAQGARCVEVRHHHHRCADQRVQLPVAGWPAVVEGPPSRWTSSPPKPHMCATLSSERCTLAGSTSRSIPLWTSGGSLRVDHRIETTANERAGGLGPLRGRACLRTHALAAEMRSRTAEPSRERPRQRTSVAGARRLLRSAAAISPPCMRITRSRREGACPFRGRVRRSARRRGAPLLSWRALRASPRPRA